MSLIDKFKEIFQETSTEPGEPPAWVGRLLEAKFTGFGGTTVFFKYGDLRTLFPAKGTVFESAIGDGAYVQRNGVGPTMFPCVWHFSGPDHDQQAKTAIKALLENGDGTLSHPIFGQTEVACVGEIEFLSPLVSGANKTNIVMELFETTGLLIGDVPPYPQLLDGFQEQAAAAFDVAINIEDPVDEESFKQRVNELVGTVETKLEQVSSFVDDVQAEVDDIGDSIRRGIDVAIGQPLNIARQLQHLVNTPAAILQDSISKISAYANLARDIFSFFSSPSGYDFEAENEFQLNYIVASASVTSVANSIVDNDLVTRKDLITAAGLLGSLMEELKTWSDDNYTTIQTDGVESSDLSAADQYSEQWLLAGQLISNAIAQLLNQAFNARTEVRTTLNKDRGLVELCYELYGSAKPDQLDFFINTNDFGGDDYLILKRGMDIVYYVS